MADKHLPGPRELRPERAVMRIVGARGHVINDKQGARSQRRNGVLKPLGLASLRVGEYEVELADSTKELERIRAVK